MKKLTYNLKYGAMGKKGSSKRALDLLDFIDKHPLLNISALEKKAELTPGTLKQSFKHWHLTDGNAKKLEAVLVNYGLPVRTEKFQMSI